MPDVWIAHEQPERPLTAGAWVCACKPCSYAIVATVATNPNLRFVVKGERGRKSLSASKVLGLVAGETLDAWASDNGLGYVREVYVQLDS